MGFAWVVVDGETDRVVGRWGRPVLPTVGRVTTNVNAPLKFFVDEAGVGFGNTGTTSLALVLRIVLHHPFDCSSVEVGIVVGFARHHPEVTMMSIHGLERLEFEVRNELGINPRLLQRGAGEPATPITVDHTTDDCVEHRFGYGFVEVHPVPRRGLLTERVLLERFNGVKVDGGGAAGNMSHPNTVDCTGMVLGEVNETVLWDVAEESTLARTFFGGCKDLRRFVPVGSDDQTLRRVPRNTKSPSWIGLGEPRPVTKGKRGVLRTATRRFTPTVTGPNVAVVEVRCVMKQLLLGVRDVEEDSTVASKLDQSPL